MLMLSELTKLIKSFAQNSAISDEEFLNAFLFPFVIAGNIKNKNDEEFHLDKARTSKIMNQRDDIPAKLREALSIYGIADKTREEMQVFIEDYLDPAKCDVLIERLLEMSRQELNKKSDSTEAGKMDLLSDLLTELLLMSLSESNVSTPDTILIWKHGINSVEVQTGDLFRYGFENRHKKKNIVVIPVNTAFDTHVTRKIENDPYPIVSENTVHGQWLVRMKESGEQLEQIDIRITKSLENGGFLPVNNSKNRHGKTICYPIGSVAVIETDNAIYFLMAMAQFDDYNNARSSSADIDKALASLLNVYDRVGLGYDLYMPLMGTGLSRAGLSLQESYDLLTCGLVRNGSKIHGHIHLVLRPEDKKEIEIKGGSLKMAYRTKTYIAGDWTGDQDLISKLYQWNDSDYWVLHFVDAHDLTQAQDSSLPCSIKRSLAERLDASKTFVLVVGSQTSALTKGSCRYCGSYNSWTQSCARGHLVDYRSFIQYECEKADRDGIRIVVIYNYATVQRDKCPAVIRYKGTHVKGYYRGTDGKLYWNYTEIKNAIMGN